MRRLMLLVGAMAMVASCAVLVSGASGSAGSVQARWVIRDLGTLGGHESRAFDVNERGQVVGTADTVVRAARIDTIEHGFLWENGMMSDLGTLPGGRWSEADAINDNGQIVGTSATGTGKKADERAHAVLWTLRSG